MVYLYSVLCCLFLFPYLGWRGGQVLPARLRRLFWAILLLIFVLFSIALLVHRHIEADWMSALMNGSVYIFFSTLYVTAFIVGVNVLRHIDERTLSLYASARPAVKQWTKVLTFIVSLVVFVGTMIIGHRNVRYPREEAREASAPGLFLRSAYWRGNDPRLYRTGGQAHSRPAS